MKKQTIMPQITIKTFKKLKDKESHGKMTHNNKNLKINLN